MLYSKQKKFLFHSPSLLLPGILIINLGSHIKTTYYCIADLQWINTSEPLSFASNLKGKIVVLDFWTYCCINCMHILPDLHKLEQIFSTRHGVVIIGVHSAKFSNERDSGNIASAVKRYGIEHAVVNDSRAVLWHQLGIQCWPTVVVIGPNGELLNQFVGEYLYCSSALVQQLYLLTMMHHASDKQPDMMSKTYALSYSYTTHISDEMSSIKSAMIKTM